MLMQGMVAGKRSRGKPRKKVGGRHQRYVWYDGGSKQSGGGLASISQRKSGQRRPDEDMLREEYMKALPSYTKSLLQYSGLWNL